MADRAAARPPGSLPVRVRTLADLPAALGRLARLVAIADHLDPTTVGRLAAEHARTVVTLSDVIARRDSVPGTAAPALLGAAGELRAHAATLADVQAVTRAWQSGAPDDRRPGRQLPEIRRQLGRDRAHLLGLLTDSDLWTVIASLHPALRFAHAVRHAVTRHVRTGAWQGPSRNPSGRTMSPDVLAAVRAASESADRLAVWLPKPIPPIRHRRSALDMPSRQPHVREPLRYATVAGPAPAQAHPMSGRTR